MRRCLNATKAFYPQCGALLGNYAETQSSESWIDTETAKAHGSLVEGFKDIVWYIHVAGDILYIVVFFERVEKFHNFCRHILF